MLHEVTRASCLTNQAGSATLIPWEHIKPEESDVWTREDWARLARRLEARRIELDTRYYTFKTFIAERGVNYRTAWDAEHVIEQGRMNITRGTMATKLDPAYGWVTGRGCENILNGEEPVALAGTPGGLAQESLPSGFDPETERMIAAFRVVWKEAQETEAAARKKNSV
jgi:hypothetical protein